jgi:predicted transcriptional regulator
VLSGFRVMELKYRSRGEIVSDLLRVVASGKSTKTRLMYGAYLSYNQIEEYLDNVLLHGLICQVPDTNLYQITEKGMQYLNLSDEISHLVAPIKVQ